MTGITNEVYNALVVIHDFCANQTGWCVNCPLNDVMCADDRIARAPGCWNLWLLRDDEEAKDNG